MVGMQENCLCGSEGGAAKAVPTPIIEADFFCNSKASLNAKQFGYFKASAGFRCYSTQPTAL